MLNVLILADPSFSCFRIARFKALQNLYNLILIAHPDLQGLAGRVPNHLLAPRFFDDINRYIGYPLLGQDGRGGQWHFNPVDLRFRTARHQYNRRLIISDGRALSRRIERNMLGIHRNSQTGGQLSQGN
ncbi:hypothetical protein D1872_265720 [compost metagenome]